MYTRITICVDFECLDIPGSYFLLQGSVSPSEAVLGVGVVLFPSAALLTLSLAGDF